MYQIGEIIEVNSKRYQIVKAIGKGKGGYSFLALLDGKYYTLKQIHHEPCSYYSFGNKIEAEQNDYQRLVKLPILLPKLIEIDFEKEIIIKVLPFILNATKNIVSIDTGKKHLYSKR